MNVPEGPWEAITGSETELHKVVGKYIVADNLYRDDALLIAAAPDLFAALAALHKQALQSSVADPENEFGQEAIAMASAALAKARGIVRLREFQMPADDDPGPQENEAA